MGTKGTWRRPAGITDAELEARWAAVFGPAPGILMAPDGRLPPGWKAIPASVESPVVMTIGGVRVTMHPPEIYSRTADGLERLYPPPAVCTGWDCARGKDCPRARIAPPPHSR